MYIVLKFHLYAKRDKIEPINKEDMTMENKQTPPVIPTSGQKEERKPHPQVPKSKKSEVNSPESHASLDIKTVLAIVFGAGSMALTILSPFTFFFNILAIIAGAVAVVLALLSFDITKLKILAMIVSIVGLAISVVIAGFLLFSAARLSWSVQNAFNHSYNYDYNYGDSFWDDDNDFWD